MSEILLHGTVVLHIDLESEEMARTVFEALAPETHAAPSERARTKIEIQGTTIVLHIEAGDLTALRAAMNSFLSWVSACQRAVASVTGQNP
ncbi:MAG: KEOPS complex subunit Pcc1 [Candidatus Thorarchaeota archaeon]|nr:MAG: hypothetical protein DRO73_02285 [Candidatus Thorarchaeota archaeon]RLI62650.1 MAG: hypothetical protein DRO93_00585 [Candidatus Thorarchaeota archaeon]